MKSVSVARDLTGIEPHVTRIQISNVGQLRWPVCEIQTGKSEGYQRFFDI